MQNKARIKNHLKNIIIVILFCSACYFLYESIVVKSEKFPSILAKDTIIYPNVPSSTDTDISEFQSSATPVFMVITNKDGVHFGIKYNSDEMYRYFLSFTSIFGEALGSSEAAYEITQYKFQDLLTKPGIFIDYITPQPFTSIANGLGTKPSESIFGNYTPRILISADGEKVALYYFSEDNNKIYKCNTDLANNSLLDKISNCPEGKSKFAFEQNQELSEFDPYFIFVNEPINISGINSINPLNENSPPLEAFGINSRVASQYNQDINSSVYVENEKTLRKTSQGKVTYEYVSKDDQIGQDKNNLSLLDYNQKATNLINTSTIGLTGNAILKLVNIDSSNFPTKCTYYYNYFVNGIPVILSDSKYAAKVTIEKGIITHVEIFYRSYSTVNSSPVVLPEKQATAIAAMQEGTPILAYKDNYTNVNVVWITDIGKVQYGQADN